MSGTLVHVPRPSIFQPAKRRTEEEMRTLAELMPRGEQLLLDAPVAENLIAAQRQASITSRLARTRRIIKRIRARHKQDQRSSKHARIVAVIPAYETEDELDIVIEKLLLQTRELDRIVVVINGPGTSNAAFEKVAPYAIAFPNRITLERPDITPGKVNALNWAFSHYVDAHKYDFMLGVDADVVCDESMTAHLEEDLLKRVDAACVMARYGFLIPEDMKGKSKALIYGQRHEFAMTGIKHQLRNDTSEIAGGQATLFRVEALRQASYKTYGGGPWDPRSKVEDAELTRTLKLLGYAIVTSREARAWTGLMFAASSWQKQRRKWQDGHLEDMLRDFRPGHDRRRWFEQFAMGWNLTIRILFAMLFITSNVLGIFAFNPWWLIPVCFAVLQSFLVALKIPQRRLGEIVRSLWFIPGEVYYVRTLSVWLDSIVLAFLNVKRDGWKNQAAAEAGTKKTALSGWAIIVLAVALPTVAFMVAARYLPEQWVAVSITWLWYTLSIMTIGSLVVMVWKVIRILRHFRTLQP